MSEQPSAENDALPIREQIAATIGHMLVTRNSPAQIADALLPVLADVWDDGMRWGQCHWSTNYYINGRVPENPHRRVIPPTRTDA